MRISKGMLAVSMASMFALTACGGEDMAEEDMAEEDMETEEDMADEDMETEEDMAGDEMDPAANLVGAGCADYAEAVPDGAGSVEGMAQDPTAVTELSTEECWERLRHATAFVDTAVIDERRNKETNR